ncbi:MAG: hypothetical protein MUF23_12275 [Pirellula sp.]|jgi:hypothetical protein|nr:hypothetical protein [Pirellula sp.]
MIDGAIIDNVCHHRPCVGGAVTEQQQPNNAERFPQFIHGLRGRGYEVLESNDAERRSTFGHHRPCADGAMTGQLRQQFGDDGYGDELRWVWNRL